MKILVLSDRYPPYFEGGYEICCEAKVNGLKKRGHEITVLTSQYGVCCPLREGNIFRYMHPLVLEFGRGLPRRLRQIKNAYLGRINYCIAKEIIAEVKPDIAYLWRLGNVSIFPALAVHKQKVLSVYELGDYWLLQCKTDFVLESNKYKKLYRNYLFGGFEFGKLDFSNLITVSEALKRQYVDIGFPSDSITVIPNGVPDEFILDHVNDKSIPNSSRFKLLYAGRIVKEKGTHIAILSIDYLVNSLGINNICLDIFGNGPQDYVKELEAIIQSRTLQDHVRIMEQIPRQELFERFSRYDAFLFPSIWEEPFGMTIIEAMARGVPVIASRVGGVPEIIQDNENGLLVTPNDPIKLAEGVKKLVEDASICKKFKKSGIRIVKEKFTNEVIVDQTEKYLLTLLEK